MYMNKLLPVFLIWLSASPAQAQHASCPNCTQPGNNLVTNGDFSQGNTGFASNLTYSATGSSNPGKYAVRNQANTFWIGGCSVTDHTSGGGTNILCVDGKTSGLTVAWEQNVTNLQPNTDYIFSFYIRFAICSPQGITPSLYVYINAGQTGDTIMVNSANWRKCSWAWNSGTATSAVLQIIDSSKGGPGNDFIIDDIALTDCSILFTANAGPDLNVCAGSPVQLNGTGTGTASCYWSGPAYLDSYTTCNPFFNCPFPGNFLYIFDYSSGSCLATDSMWVHVNAWPVKPVITQLADSLLAPWSYGYQWYSSTGMLPGETNRYFLPVQAGYYSVSVFNSAGCSASSDSLLYTPCSQLITVDAGPDQVVCAGLQVNLQANSNGPSSCTWSGPPGLDNYQACNPSFSSSTGGTYTYLVTAILSGCLAQDSVSVSVNSLPSQPVISRNADTLFANSAGPWQWYRSGSLLNGATDSWYLPAVNDYYQVEVSNPQGCSSRSDSAFFQFCAEALTVAACADTAVCAGTPCTLSVSGTGTGNYLWSGPPGLDNYASNSPVFMQTSGGDYAYFVTGHLDGCLATDTVNIHVHNLPPVPLVTQQADSLVSSPALFYQWYSGNSALVNDTSFFLVPLQNGYYYVVITDQNGCASSSDSIVPGFTSISETTGHLDMLIRYDETASQVIIQNNSNTPETITAGLYDISGKRLQRLSGRCQPGTAMIIHTGRLPAGIYFLQVTTEKSNLFSRILAGNP